MPLSRALKNVMRGEKSPKSGDKGPKAFKTPSSKQYNQSGPKDKGPNYDTDNGFGPNMTEIK